MAGDLQDRRSTRMGASRMAKRKGRVVVDADRCKGCGLCVAWCPTQSLQPGSALNRLGYHPVEFVPDTGCTGCGVCFYMCPEPAALTVLHVHDEAVEAADTPAGRSVA
jgi:ferredoxin